MNAFDVILHPTDFSDNADQAFQFACGIARDQFSKMIVLHAILPTSSPEGPDTDPLSESRPAIRHCREQFQRLKALAGDVPLTFRIALGYPVEVILEIAQQENVNVIVMASHRQSQFHLQLHGSVAEGVLRQAQCPVLCLRQPNPGTRNIAGDQYQPTDKLH